MDPHAKCQLECQGLLDAKDAELARMDAHLEELVALVDDLSRPAFGRKGKGTAGTSTIGKRVPRTRRSVIFAAFLVLVAVSAILILTPIANGVCEKHAQPEIVYVHPSPPFITDRGAP